MMIVGASECVPRTATALRGQGYNGRITVGDERYAPYERPPLSKAAFADAESGIGPGNAVALAKTLIALGAAPSASELASPAVKLKALLAA
jgi:hypothetical protein